MKGTVTIRCLGCTYTKVINNPNMIETYQGCVVTGVNKTTKERYVCPMCEGNLFKVVDINVIA